MRERPLILVVDDNEDNREIARARLEANRYDVELAVDGEEGLARAKELRPDLILLDVMMPKLDGIEVVKRLKADGDLPFIPVLLLTAKSGVKDVVQGLQLVLHLCTQPGDGVVVHTPAYPPFLHSVEDTGRRVVRVAAQADTTGSAGWPGLAFASGLGAGGDT